MAGGTRTADIRLGIAATFTANNLVPFIGTGLIEVGYLPVIRVAPYNQIFQACAGAFFQDCNCALLLWRIEDLMLDELTAFVGGDPDALGSAFVKLDQLTDAVSHLRGTFPAR